MGMLSGVATPASATSVSVLGAITAGTGFTNISTVTLAPTGGTGSGLAAIPTSLKNISDTIATPGTGYAINDTITLAGGTLQPGGPGAATVLTVSKAQIVGLATQCRRVGSGYAAGDTITLAGGTLRPRLRSSPSIPLMEAAVSPPSVSLDAGVYTAEASSFTQASTRPAQARARRSRPQSGACRPSPFRRRALTPPFLPLPLPKAAPPVREPAQPLTAFGVSAPPRSPTAATIPAHLP